METIKKEHGVVMLATEDKVIDGSLISRSIDDKLAITNCLTLEDKNAEKDEHKNNYLYFTSDEEIKKGDWLHNSFSNNIGKALFDERGDLHLRKIIATTDPKLGITDHRVSPVPNFCDFPQIPQSFIESYVKNPVDKVELEYVQATYEDWMENGASPVPNKLKLDNNEVVVVPEKNTMSVVEFMNKQCEVGKLYTKEEVEELCKSAMSNGYNAGQYDAGCHDAPYIKESQWLKDNL